jgi:hypothetical protein
MKKGMTPQVEAALQQSLQYLQAKYPDMHWVAASGRGYHDRVLRYLTCDPTGRHTTGAGLRWSNEPWEHSVLGGDSETPYTPKQAAALQTLPEGAVIGSMRAAKGNTPMSISRIGFGGQVVTAGRNALGMNFYAPGLELYTPQGQPFETAPDNLPRRSLNHVDIEAASTLSPGEYEVPERHLTTDPYGNDRPVSYGETLADGTPEELDGTPTRAGVVPSPNQHHGDWEPPRNIQAAQRDALIRRWKALSDPVDRERIRGFWLGHHHPLLAAVGMELLGQGTSPP